jgi:inorganic pyrophosphatase
MIAINSEDPLFSVLNDIEDVEKYCPATLSGIREWFRWYKTPDGRPPNTFGFGEKCLNRRMAEEVIHETHGHYMNLKNGKTDKGKLWLTNI